MQGDSEKVPTNGELANEAQRLLAIVETQAAVLQAGHDVASVMQLIAGAAQRLTGAAGAAIELRDGDEMVYRAATGFAAPHVGVRLRIDRSLSGLCVTSGEILTCTDTETDARVDRACCNAIGIRSMVVVPLADSDRRVGVLKVMSRAPGSFGECHVGTLRLIAGFMTAAISRAAAFDAKQELLASRTAALDELSRHAALHRLLHVVAAAANAATTLEEALEAGIDRVCDHTGWSVGHAYLAPGGSETMLLSSGVWRAPAGPIFESFREATLRARFRSGEGLPGRVLESGDPHWIEDIEQSNGFPRKHAARDAGLRAGFAFPVRAWGDVVAVMEFYSAKVEAPDRALLDGMRRIGDQLGRVIERQHAENALRASEERHRRIIDAASDAFIATDEQGFISDWNRQAEVTFGWSRDEAIGCRLSELIIPEATRAEHAASFDRFVATGEGMIVNRRIEVLARHRSGREFPVELTMMPLFWQESLMFCAFLHDISERKRLQEQIVLAGRMASVGTLASGVAHEINNPLAYVVANIDFVVAQLTDASARIDRAESPVPGALTWAETAGWMRELRQSLGEAQQGAARVRNIVRDLKTFARADDERREPVQVRRVLESTINMAFNEIRHRARLVKDYGDVPAVNANESRLGQVFLNLLINAAQAIREGQADHNEIRIVTRLAVDGRVVTEVHDTGVGIPPEHLPRLFDPFFTTKPVGVGTGLGLSICHGIVEALGGEITVESSVGRGSVFRIYLPAAPPEEKNEPPPEEKRPSLGRVLIVDDEPLLLSTMRRVLGSEYQVDTEPNGRKALDRIRGGQRYGVIISDLMMSDVSGSELHEALLEMAPDQAARMVFITGGAFTPAARAFLDRVPNLRLEKPFEMANLRALVRELLRDAKP